MNGRMLLKWPLGLALVFGMLFGSSAKATAQSPTTGITRCVSGAADALKDCVDDLPWYAEALCYARYASDGVLCAPSVVYRAM